MPTFNSTFAGGVTAVPAFGQRSQILFKNSNPAITSFANGDIWNVTLVTTSNTVVVGGGNLVGTTNTLSPVTSNYCITYKNRVYLGEVSRFGFSDNGDPTSWDKQAPGAGFIPYLSYFGSQDTIQSLSQLQGRLVVFGARSTQIWTVDADPNNFALQQEMDNIGTVAPLSPQNIGDFDVIALDYTGFRSIRQREVTLNAYVDDVGISVDSLVQLDLATDGLGANACGIVEPTSKRYWCYINGKIYVLSRFPSSKISAWSIYIPTDQFGLVFTPIKFIIFGGQVWCRTTDGRLVSHGGSLGFSYDATVMTVELPWMDDKDPKMLKYYSGFDIACSGQFQLTTSTDSRTFAKNAAQVLPVFTVAGATGDESYDSSFDLLNIAFPQRGTHIKIILKTTAAWTDLATLSMIQYHWNPSK